MIPIKDKKYMINFKGYWGSYIGEGVCTGDVDSFCGENGDTFIYGFKIPTDEETCFFLETDIVAEIASDVKIKTEEEIQEQIDSENILHEDLEASLAIVEEIGQYLVSDKVMRWMKGDSWSMFAGLVATKVLIIVEKELHKNGYEIRKIKDN